MISGICVSCRDEVAKAIRRALGDNGGVKFRHGTYNFRGGWSNAIDTVLKDNLLMEVYALRSQSTSTRSTTHAPLDFTAIYRQQ